MLKTFILKRVMRIKNRAVIAERVFRTGRQQLLWNPARKRWFMLIQNRTYFSVCEVPADRVELWKRALS